MRDGILSGAGLMPLGADASMRNSQRDSRVVLTRTKARWPTAEALGRKVMPPGLVPSPQGTLHLRPMPGLDTRAVPLPMQFSQNTMAGCTVKWNPPGAEPVFGFCTCLYTLLSRPLYTAGTGNGAKSVDPICRVGPMADERCVAPGGATEQPAARSTAARHRHAASELRSGS